MDEVETVASIFDQYRVHYGETADVEQSSRWLRENIGSGRVQTFVAEDRARLVGFATTMQIPASLRLSHFWQIRDLFVLPQHRRLGIGGALLGAVRAAAVESGALRLVLQTEEENGPALALYAEVGFVPVTGYRALTLPLD
jgi:GNAT superfamily N-acetyltransferase